MKQKCIIVSAWIALMLVSSSSQYTTAASSSNKQSIEHPKVILNGTELQFPHAPFITRGVTMVPGKSFFKSMNYSVTYDVHNQMLTAEKQEDRITIKADEQFATVNNLVKQLPLSTMLVDGEIYIPLRFFAELDNRNVRWDSTIRTIRINAPSNKLLSVTLTLPYRQPTEEFFQGKGIEKLNELIEREYNVNLEWEVVANDHYQDKLHVMIAAGQPLDLAYMANPTIYPSDLLESIAYKLDNKLAHYGALSQLPAASVAQLKQTTSGIYGLPKLTSGVDGVFPVVNQDWLDKLGLAYPKTIEELSIVMQYFVKYDPDGNGKDDTYGLSGYINKVDLGALAWVEHVFNENASRYERRGNEVIDLALSQSTREALLWLNKAYAEGLIDPEILINTSDKAKQMLNDEKAGIVAMKLAEGASIDQNNKLTPLISMQHHSGSAAVTATSPAFDGMYFISRFAKNDELEASLEVMNAMYQIANDPSADADIRALAMKVVGSAAVQLNDVETPIKERYSQIEAARSELAVKELLEGQLYAKLDAQMLAIKTELDQQMTEMKVKVIVGALPIEEWDSYVAKLSKDSNYIAIMDAFNE